MLWRYARCIDVFDQWITAPGFITVEDRNWQNGDLYFILPYRFTSHNTPYGPFRQ